MSRIESADKIEGIVGAKRHATTHLGRAVSAEQRVYVLHPHECVARGIDLRECEYSTALDLGIDLSIWAEWQDRPVALVIDGEDRDLIPMHYPGVLELETFAERMSRQSVEVMEAQIAADWDARNAREHTAGEHPEECTCQRPNVQEPARANSSDPS